MTPFVCSKFNGKIDISPLNSPTPTTQQLPLFEWCFIQIFMSGPLGLLCMGEDTGDNESEKVLLLSVYLVRNFQCFGLNMIVVVLKFFQSYIAISLAGSIVILFFFISHATVHLIACYFIKSPNFL